jgi:predicted enzyme related to lactoylglutathione lyase
MPKKERNIRMAQATQAGIKITGIDIHAYLVKDAKRAIAFYRDVLGLVPDEESEEGAEFTLGDGATFGVWDPKGAVPWKKGNGVMFAVQDIDAALAFVRSKGAKFGDVMETGACWMTVGEDPDGNEVILHKRKT